MAKPKTGKSGKGQPSALTAYNDAQHAALGRETKKRVAALQKVLAPAVEKFRAALGKGNVDADALGRTAIATMRGSHADARERLLAQHGSAVTKAIEATGLGKPEARREMLAAVGIEEHAFVQGQFLTGHARPTSSGHTFGLGGELPKPPKAAPAKKGGR